MKTATAMLAAVAAVTLLLPSGHALADARSDKLDLYIEVHNMFTTRMRANHDNYVPTLAGLDPENPCTLERQPGGDMYHTADSTGAIDGYRRRLRRAPRLPQDRLVTAMLDAAAIQVPAWNAAFDYYGRRVYTTDQCAQGNVYHRQLMAAFQAYFAADAELLVFIDTENRARRVTALQQTERTHGRNFRFYRLTEQLGVDERSTTVDLHRGVPTQHLHDRRTHQRRVRPEAIELAGVQEERPEAVADQVGGGLETRRVQQQDVRDEFFRRQALTRFLRLDKS